MECRLVILNAILEDKYSIVYETATICELLDVCSRVNVVSSVCDESSQLFVTAERPGSDISSLQLPIDKYNRLWRTTDGGFCISPYVHSKAPGTVVPGCCHICPVFHSHDNESDISGQQNIFTLHKIQQLVGASRYVHTVSTEIGSDEESDVISVCNFEADHGSDQLFEVESDGEVFIYTSVIYTTDNGSDGATTDSEFENEYTSPNGIIWKRRPFAPRSRRQDITVELRLSYNRLSERFLAG
ncbi:hypothetical protein T11_13219 [Trichinella zimbabwensis]|uniref:Uncharacterized protein n=1 Tax=Trichinella zimbabwensis TaxID=268475 RepID=A0A0V1I262_9BILA|nr:hypothetical protein T11_13219 [Trichinella zimbabwensis]